ncbi:MAG: hypothetical protein JNG85_08410 [Spirochaetaceae bacterium]|nr:hypothetical protein [Spirochaetaceae bacterium]
MSNKVEKTWFPGIANLFHFLPIEHLHSLIKEKTFFFQNICKYELQDLEYNYAYIDGDLYKSSGIGTICFTREVNNLFKYSVWEKYGDKYGRGSACVGFYQGGAQDSSPNISSDPTKLEYAPAAKQLSHNFGETVFECRVNYVPNIIENIPKELKTLTPFVMANARNKMFFTNVTDSDVIKDEQRFVARVDDCDGRSLKWCSRFIKKIAVVILGPDADEAKYELVCGKYDGPPIRFLSAKKNSDNCIELEYLGFKGFDDTPLRC